jgi:hypothetical protein
MSGGTVCKCAESKKPMAQRAWVVTQRKCNHSAFNGYHYQYSQWSAIVCLGVGCPAAWRTKAAYVAQLADAKHTPSGYVKA